MGNDYCDGCGENISRNGYCKCTLANIRSIGRHSNPDDCDSCEVLQAKLKISEEMLRFFERERCKFDEMAKQEGARSMLDYVTRHYAVNKVATDDEVFQYWKDEQK